MKNKLILLLLGLLGFSACDNLDMYGTPEPMPPMYGPPPVHDFRFSVSGKVTDTKGTPVEGIVVAGPDGREHHTADDGSYEIRGGGYSFYPVGLTFTDPDGPANGGEFAEQRVEDILTEADRNPDGEYVKRLDVTLEEKP